MAGGTWKAQDKRRPGAYINQNSLLGFHRFG